MSAFGEHLNAHLRELKHNGQAYVVKIDGLPYLWTVVEHSPTHLVLVDDHITHFINLDTITRVTVEEL